MIQLRVSIQEGKPVIALGLLKDKRRASREETKSFDLTLEEFDQLESQMDEARKKLFNYR